MFVSPRYIIDLHLEKHRRKETATQNFPEYKNYKEKYIQTYN